jgi:uncharacterized membrane protein
VSRNTLKAVDIDAPPERVFAVLKDVEHWPEWTPTMLSVKRLESGPFGVGSTVEVRQPRLRPAIWHVTEIAEGRNFTWTARSPGVLMKAGHQVEAHGNGSRAVLRFEISGLMAPLVSLLYGKLIDEYVSTETQGLKKRCETADA